jgi:hypothetical protein
MIFNKEFISQNFEEKVKAHVYQIHPFETHYNDKEKSPLEAYMQSYFTFFDIESDKMKEKRYQANVEITENCYKPEYLDVYPNSSKINQCIRDIEYKHLGKYNEKRDVFFGNGKGLY